jgi:cytochrome c-type biogenesis protein CcmF
MINPLVWWVWLGGYFLVAGTIIAIWPRKKKE